MIISLPKSNMKLLLTLLSALLISTLILTSAHHGSKVKPPEGYVALFDGKSMDGWFTTFDNDVQVWSADPETGTLARSIKGGYLWTEKQYGDFVLDLEYKLSRRCNSGIFFRTDPGNPVQGGFEIQLYDDSQGIRPKNGHGSLYDAVAASSNPSKKIGQWDKMRIRVKGDSVRIWINNVKVTEADLSEWTTPQMNPDGSKEQVQDGA